MPRRPARPRDPNQLAKLMLDMTTGEYQATPQFRKKAVFGCRRAEVLRQLGDLRALAPHHGRRALGRRTGQCSPRHRAAAT